MEEAIAYLKRSGTESSFDEARPLRNKIAVAANFLS